MKNKTADGNTNRIGKKARPKCAERNARKGGIYVTGENKTV